MMSPPRKNVGWLTHRCTTGSWRGVRRVARIGRDQKPGGMAEAIPPAKLLGGSVAVRLIVVPAAVVLRTGFIVRPFVVVRTALRTRVVVGPVLRPGVILRRPSDVAVRPIHIAVLRLAVIAVLIRLVIVLRRPVVIVVLRAVVVLGRPRDVAVGAVVVV